MKNITITLDDQTAAWARQAAAEQGKSLSRYIGDMLQHSLEQSREYQQAMQAWLAHDAYICSDAGVAYPSREQLYDGGRFR